MRSSTAILYLFSKIGNFSLFRPITSHSLVVVVQHGLAAPSSILLAPSVSSPCPDANGGIDLLMAKSSDWLTLRLVRVNQMWKGESSESPVMEGY